ncbi:aminoacyl-tRNA hydrolase [endosymbiont of Pachyrhynchus infernalis]|uniref:aminoacyl-tRNA hydrolase n=1 Tax=endosymbiont of Pachyrhynchus infernalis TaxID=1971488 RepID=UPI000DC6D6E5|nr:aminoacyl-tRNA hydrolase [endosymbiont of Pachyrhynchus infernalis]BBA84873.1 peptidyl-tRNA hydrolase [endosymbiont of Pachyrhynchus infernalis]
MNIKLIAGIGNNLKQYYDTRHNVGIWFINNFIKKYSLNLKYNNKINCFFSKLKLNNNNLILLIPNSFINLSGIYIKKSIIYFKINSNELLIVHDDLYFNIGKFKIKFGGSSAGHNGVKSIINNIYNNFYRLRIGIKNYKNIDNISDFVLSEPNKLEKNIILNSINDSIEYIINFLDKN